MKSKKILLFSMDPGGANTIMPLVRPLKEKGYKVRLLGKGVAIERYLKFGVTGFNIEDVIKQIDLKHIEEFLMNERPDFIITGTSTGTDFTEKYLWKVGEKLKIPSFAILDQWINYGIRFSKYSLSEIKEYNNVKMHDYLPSKILVMDDYAKDEAAKDGLDPLRMIVTGQPYFETLLEEKEKVSPEKIEKLKRELGIGESDFIITFASEPISKDYNKYEGNEHYWGYTEQTVFKELLDVVRLISHRYEKLISIIVRLHPRENRTTYNDIISLHQSEKRPIIINRELNPWDLILASDLVCGMSSMFLIESVILKKPTISVLTGLKRENPFILDRRGVMRSITDRETLLEYLKQIIIYNNFVTCQFDIIKDSVNNIISQMEKFICPN